MTRLEAVHTLAQLESFDAAEHLARVREQLAPEPRVTLAALDAAGVAVRAVLAELDRFAEKSMRLRMDAALAGDTTVQPVLRKTLAATVLKYAGDLETLRSRVPGGAADAVVEAAERVLADRAALRDGVRAIAGELAKTYLPGARAERDRAVGDEDRGRWDAAVHDLEDLLGEARSERAEPPEVTRGELLEFD